MVEVRTATAADVNGIRRVARVGWEAAYGDFMAASTVEAVLAEYYDQETVEQAVASDAVVYLVADDGGVVGYASGTGAEEDPKTAILSSIYVDPERWDEGIGRALFDQLRKRLRERGFERVRATVLAENDAGQPFYDARGFERVDEREEIVAEESHRALVVERDL